MIRSYRAGSDAADIIRLIRTELVPLSHNAGYAGRLSDRDLAARLKRGAAFVASRGRTARPDGFIHVDVRNDVLFVDMLAVQPSLRRRNVGGRLMAFGEAYGRSAGCSKACLFVDEGNERAHRFYARLGYATVRYVPNYRCF
ncbi:GNAT family N-acetyltransferase, partial [Paenibacillus darwinianus]